MWPLIVNGFGVYYMLNACLCYRYLSPVVVVEATVAQWLGAQWLGASNIFRQICKSTSEWRWFEWRGFYQSGFEFAKTPLLILNH